MAETIKSGELKKPAIYNTLPEKAAFSPSVK